MSQSLGRERLLRALSEGDSATGRTALSVPAAAGLGLEPRLRGGVVRTQALCSVPTGTLRLTSSSNSSHVVLSGPCARGNWTVYPLGRHNQTPSAGALDYRHAFHPFWRTRSPSSRCQKVSCILRPFSLGLWVTTIVLWAHVTSSSCGWGWGWG